MSFDTGGSDPGSGHQPCGRRPYRMRPLVAALLLGAYGCAAGCTTQEADQCAQAGCQGTPCRWRCGLVEPSDCWDPHATLACVVMPPLPRRISTHRRFGPCCGSTQPLSSVRAPPWQHPTLTYVRAPPWRHPTLTYVRAPPWQRLPVRPCGRRLPRLGRSTGRRGVLSGRAGTATAARVCGASVRSLLTCASCLSAPCWPCAPFDRVLPVCAWP